MEGQQQQQPQLPTATQSISNKNIKNLSIREFITNRLMRARSFEGNQSPKDEATNWFDEFKARMTKKSQASSSKQAYNVGAGAIDEDEDERLDSSENISYKPNSSQSKNQLFKNDRDCDNESDSRESSNDCFEDTAEDGSPIVKGAPNLTLESRGGLRFRKKAISHRSSSFEVPDFDTASINTIFNRRDSRYTAIPGTGVKQLSFANIFINPLRWLFIHMLPLNYTLPWKLMTFASFTFVIIVIAMIQASNPDSKAFSFLNGFICGLLIASLGLVVIILSLFIRLLPKPPKSQTATRTKIDRSSKFFGTKSVRLDQDSTKLIPEKNTEHFEDEQRIDDYSSFEVLESQAELGDEPGVKKLPNDEQFDDEDFKGWMIEFVGDYELRNKSDIKLKLLYVELKQRTLYLSKTKSRDTDSNTFPTIVSQRMYNLNKASKFSASLLIPRNVRNRQKWVWSKRYPIRLEIHEELGELINRTSSEPNSKVVQLTLFAKSCREKEEWFRRFKQIIEKERLAKGVSMRRSSLQSDISAIDADSSTTVAKDLNLRTISPTPGRDCVQTSQSSHLICDSSKLAANDDEASNTPDSSLTRTKSCELLNRDLSSSVESSSQQESIFLGGIEPATEAMERSFLSSSFKNSSANDSTLTQETADLFSQEVNFSNFVESLPSLDYREYIERVIESSQEATSTSDWFNSLVGRIFFDVFSHNYWSLWFKRKIQRKLRRIRLPYFMETLTLTQIDLGTNAPQFLNVVSHKFDSLGLSIDFDMAYSGGLTMTFETKLNLLKIKSDNSSSANIPTQSQAQIGVTVSATTGATSSSPPTVNSSLPDQTNDSNSSKDASSLSDSSLDCPSNMKENASREHGTSSSGNSSKISENSSESDKSDSESSSSSSSSDEEADVDEISDWEDYGAEKTRQNIVRFVDKIASSRYFQQATENRYIKKKLLDISNCPLVLVVQIQSLNGVLTVNVPPPQTNRIWYGFKPNVELVLRASPRLGDKTVSLSHVTDWIEKKLAEEFRKVLVLPNGMDDVICPLLKSDHLKYVASTK